MEKNCRKCAEYRQVLSELRADNDRKAKALATIRLTLINLQLLTGGK